MNSNLKKKNNLRFQNFVNYFKKNTTSNQKTPKFQTRSCLMSNKEEFSSTRIQSDVSLLRKNMEKMISDHRKRKHQVIIEDVEDVEEISTSKNLSPIKNQIKMFGDPKTKDLSEKISKEFKNLFKQDNTLFGEHQGRVVKIKFEKNMKRVISTNCEQCKVVLWCPHVCGLLLAYTNGDDCLSSNEMLQNIKKCPKHILTQCIQNYSQNNIQFFHQFNQELLSLMNHEKEEEVRVNLEEFLPISKPKDIPLDVDLITRQLESLVQDHGMLRGPDEFSKIKSFICSYLKLSDESLESDFKEISLEILMSLLNPFFSLDPHLFFDENDHFEYLTVRRNISQHSSYSLKCVIK
jgi:hypothetical protein